MYIALKLSHRFVFTKKTTPKAKQSLMYTVESTATSASASVAVTIFIPSIKSDLPTSADLAYANSSHPFNIYALSLYRTMSNF